MLFLDDLGWSTVVGDFDASDFSLPAGLHLHILWPADHGVNGDAAEGDRGRKGGNFKFDRLDRLGAGRVHGANRDGIPPRRQVRRVQHKCQLIAADDRAHIGLGAQADDGRLSQSCDAAAKRVADQGAFGQPLDFQARRQHLHFKGFFDDCALPAGVDGADVKRMLLREQQEGIQVKVIWGFGIDLDDFAIDDEFHLRDLGLAAGVDRNDIRFGDIRLVRRFKVIAEDRRQRGDFKLCAQAADITLNIGDRDIQLMLARLLLFGFDGVGFFSGDHFPIDGVFDALDVLVGADFDFDGCIFGQGLVKYVFRQGEQRNRYRGAQGRAAGSGPAIGCRDLEGEVVALAVGGHISAEGDEVLAAEEESEVAVDIDQFFRRGGIIEFGVGLGGDQFEKAPINIPAQANRIDGHAVDGRGADAFIAAVLADCPIFAAIAKNDDSLARQGRLVGEFDAAQGGVVQGGLAAVGEIVDHVVELSPIGGVMDNLTHAGVKGDDGDGVVGTQGVYIVPRGGLGLGQWAVRHTAAGINDQHAGESQAIVQDVLHIGDLGQTGQVAADGKIADIEARDEFSGRVQNAGVDGDL